MLHSNIMFFNIQNYGHVFPSLTMVGELAQPGSDAAT